MNFNGFPILLEGRRSPIRKISEPAKSSTMSYDNILRENRECSESILLLRGPDGVIHEGLPVGYKHITPEITPPLTPRASRIATIMAEGIELRELMNSLAVTVLWMVLICAVLDIGCVAWEGKMLFAALRQSGTLTPGLSIWSAVSESIGSRLKSIEGHNLTLIPFPLYWPLSVCVAVFMIDVALAFASLVIGSLACLRPKPVSYGTYGTFLSWCVVYQLVGGVFGKLSVLLLVFRMVGSVFAKFTAEVAQDRECVEIHTAARIYSSPGSPEVLSVRSF